MIRFLQRLGRARNVLPSRSLRLAYYSLSRLTRRAPCLFVSAFRKSGSTFLVTAVVHASGYSRYFSGQNFNSVHDLHLQDAVSQTIRKNVGIRGRGQSELTRAQLARLDLLTRHYPGTDFTSIGAPLSTQGDS